MLVKWVTQLALVVWLPIRQFGGLQQKILIKLMVDGNLDQVLGAHMVGEYAAEIIQCLALAIKKGVTKEDFNEMIGIHPTAVEEFFTL